MDVTWYDEGHLPGLVDLVQAVAGTGGAVGWLTVPSPAEVQVWLRDLLASGARLAVALDSGDGGNGDKVVGCAGLRRQQAVVLAGMAAVTKVMTHPRARGRGVGAALLAELVGAARAEGIELLTLECRGNNHGAQRLYASVGFVVTGRRPDAIAVGRERFDQVLMHLDLRTGPAGLVRHGSRHEGPGAT